MMGVGEHYVRELGIQQSSRHLRVPSASLFGFPHDQSTQCDVNSSEDLKSAQKHQVTHSLTHVMLEARITTLF